MITNLQKLTKKSGRDVIVIGAGIIGAASAYYLSKVGFKVTIFDGGKSEDSCSFGNAGLIAIDHVSPLASPATLAGLPKMLFQRDGPLKFHLSSTIKMFPWIRKFISASMPNNFRRNTEALASLTTRATGAWTLLLKDGVCINLHRNTGSLYVFEKPEHEKTKRNLLSTLDHFNVVYENLSIAQIRERYLPSLKTSLSHGRFFPDMASVSNQQKVVESLLSAAARVGATLVRTNVQMIEFIDQHRFDVRSNGNNYGAQNIVVATGIGSKNLLSKFGIALPITGERGYHVELDAASNDTLRVPVSFVERGFSCNPMENGIRLAGTVEIGGGQVPNYMRAELLARHFGELFEGPRPSVRSSWSGERPTLPDYLPVISRLPQARNIIVATGHQHLGLTLGPLTGEIVVKLLTDEKITFDITPFRIDRF